MDVSSVGGPRAELRDPLRDLVIAVAYAEHWLRDTDAFAAACLAYGLRYAPGRGLFEMAERRIANPFE